MWGTNGLDILVGSVGIQEGSPGLSKQDSLEDCLDVLGFMETPPFRAELHLSAPTVA